MSFVPVTLSVFSVIFAYLPRHIARYVPQQTDKYASKIQLNSAVGKIKTASKVRNDSILLPCRLAAVFVEGVAGYAGKEAAGKMPTRG